MLILSDNCGYFRMDWLLKPVRFHIPAELNQTQPRLFNPFSCSGLRWPAWFFIFQGDPGRDQASACRAWRRVPAEPGQEQHQPDPAGRAAAAQVSVLVLQNRHISLFCFMWTLRSFWTSERWFSSTGRTFVVWFGAHRGSFSWQVARADGGFEKKKGKQEVTAWYLSGFCTLWYLNTNKFKNI